MTVLQRGQSCWERGGDHPLSFESRIMCGKDETWDYSILFHLLLDPTHALVGPGTSQEQAVRVIRDLHQRAFQYVGDCSVSLAEFEAARTALRTFLVEFDFSAAVCETFDTQVIDIVSAERFVVSGDDNIMRAYWGGLIQSWGDALGHKLDDLGKDLSLVAKDLSEVKDAVREGFAKTTKGVDGVRGVVDQLQLDAERLESKVDRIAEQQNDANVPPDPPNAAQVLRDDPPLNDVFLDIMKIKRGDEGGGVVRFRGREWLFRDIEAKCAEPAGGGSGVPPGILIIGGPGMGKSAAMAELVCNREAGRARPFLRRAHRRVIAHHICDAKNLETCQPEMFVRNLVGQLSRWSPAFFEQVCYAEDPRGAREASQGAGCGCGELPRQVCARPAREDPAAQRGRWAAAACGGLAGRVAQSGGQVHCQAAGRQT